MIAIVFVSIVALAAICGLLFYRAELRNASRLIVAYQNAGDEAERLEGDTRRELAIVAEERDALATEQQTLKDRLAVFSSGLEETAQQIGEQLEYIRAMPKAMRTYAQDERERGERASAETDEQPGLETWDCTGCCEPCRLLSNTADGTPTNQPYNCPFMSDTKRVKWSPIELASPPVGTE